MQTKSHVCEKVFFTASFTARKYHFRKLEINILYNGIIEFILLNIYTNWYFIDKVNTTKRVIKTRKHDMEKVKIKHCYR